MSGGAPFSTNLRRMYRRQSDGGAGADYAEERLAAEGKKRKLRHSGFFSRLMFMLRHGRWPRQYAREDK